MTAYGLCRKYINFNHTKLNSCVSEKGIFKHEDVFFFYTNILQTATVQKGGERMGNINEQIAKAEEEIRQLQNRKKKLLNQKKSEERKIRTHRLVERGAILESLLEQPEQYTNEQIKGLLETALQTPQAQEFLRRTQKPKGEN